MTTATQRIAAHIPRLRAAGRAGIADYAERSLALLSGRLSAAEGMEPGGLRDMTSRVLISQLDALDHELARLDCTPLTPRITPKDEAK